MATIKRSIHKVRINQLTTQGTLNSIGITHCDLELMHSTRDTSYLSVSYTHLDVYKRQNKYTDIVNGSFCRELNMLQLLYKTIF